MSQVKGRVEVANYVGSESKVEKSALKSTIANTPPALILLIMDMLLFATPLHQDKIPPVPLF
jgi:hypothetical protein